MSLRDQVPLKYRLLSVYLILPIFFYVLTPYYTTALINSSALLPAISVFCLLPFLTVFVNWNHETIRNILRFTIASIFILKLINAFIYIVLGPEDDFLEWNKKYYPNHISETKSKFIGLGPTDWIKVNSKNASEVKWDLVEGQVLLTKSHEKANYGIWLEGKKIPCTGPKTYKIKQPTTFTFYWIHPDYNVNFKVE